MSTIEKLIIRGIRSYNPTHTATLDFQTPLTIIVGPNGSGKTTIIESLKYITTNDLPLNSKGGAFVYDPRILGQTDVKSQVKLRFRNVNGCVMVITRSLQVIQKKTGVTQKTLESTLLFKSTPANIDEESINEDENIPGKLKQSKNKKQTSKEINKYSTGDVSVSNRCANIDTEVQHHLGVSSAILQNVIFCHQEESNWILSEPGNVKKKLDDIFSTSKYSKALDTIRSLRKDSSTSFKMKSQELEFLADKKIKREKIETRVFEDRQRVVEIQGKIEVLEGECKELDFESVSREIGREEERCDLYRRIGMDIVSMKSRVFDLKRRMDISEIREEMERIANKQENTSIYDFEGTFIFNAEIDFGEDLVQFVMKYNFDDYFSGIESEIETLKNDEIRLEKRYNILNSRKGGITDFKRLFDEISINIAKYESRESELLKSINLYFGREIKVDNLLSDEYFNSIICENKIIFTEKNKYFIDEITENTVEFERMKKEVDLLKDEKNKVLYKSISEKQKLRDCEEKVRSNGILLKDNDEDSSSDYNEDMEVKLLNQREVIELTLARRQEELSTFLQHREDDILINEQIKRKVVLLNKIENSEKELETKLGSIMTIKIDNQNMDMINEMVNEYNTYILSKTNNENGNLDNVNINCVRVNISNENISNINNNVGNNIDYINNNEQEDLFSSSDSFLNFSDEEDHKHGNETVYLFTYNSFNIKCEGIRDNIKILLGKVSEKQKEMNILIYTISKIINGIGNTGNQNITDFLYEEKLEDEQIIRERIKELENKLSISTNAHYIYKNFQKKGLRYNACHLCKKVFTGNDREEYNNKIETVLDKMPERREEAEKELVELCNKIGDIESENEIKRKRNIIFGEICGLIRKMKSILGDNKLLNYLCEIIDSKNNNHNTNNNVNNNANDKSIYNNVNKISISKFIKYLEKSSELEEPVKNLLSSLNSILSISKYINDKKIECGSINVAKKENNTDIQGIKSEINNLKERSMEIKKELAILGKKKEKLRNRQSQHNIIEENKNIDIEIQRLVLSEHENAGRIDQLCRDVEILEGKIKGIYDKLKSSTEIYNSMKIKFNIKNEEVKKNRNELKISVNEKGSELDLLHESINDFANEIKVLKNEILDNGTKRNNQLSKDMVFENMITKNKKMCLDENISFLKQHSSSFIFEDNKYTDLNHLEASKHNNMTLSVLNNSVRIFFNDLNKIQEELMGIKFKYNEKCGVLNSEKENVRQIVENIKKLECDIKISKLEKEYKVYDTKKLDELKIKLAKLQERKNNLVSEKYLLFGEYKQLERNLESINHELETDYKDITNKYSECYIETKAIELIVEDLDKCIKALDKSIVEYHSGKIEEVNHILRDLWINTYKCNDIEYIQLKSETNDNKIYNYRVVMIKNGIELDLRGRCSAGQKVLASILMRLALSDAFSSNFSVMALDEPTTNLDKENVEALAITLGKIINKRRANKNFQLIVITHDEDFVELMNREGVDYVYRVSRDRNGDSQIEKQEVF